MKLLISLDVATLEEALSILTEAQEALSGAKVTLVREDDRSNSNMFMPIAGTKHYKNTKATLSEVLKKEKND